jgi:hypothetical protein
MESIPIYCGNRQAGSRPPESSTARSPVLARHTAGYALRKSYPLDFTVRTRIKVMSGTAGVSAGLKRQYRYVGNKSDLSAKKLLAYLPVLSRRYIKVDTHPFSCRDAQRVWRHALWQTT